MEEHVYSGSVIWWLADIVNTSVYLLYPIVIFAVALLWAIKAKSKLSFLALFGAVLCLGANVTHRVIGEVKSVALGYPVPHIEENVFIWFIFRQGISLGLFLFALALLIYFWKQKNA
jgi:hypothetical protein